MHSYHSFCVKYYDRGCFTDTVMMRVLEKSRKKPSDSGGGSSSSSSSANPFGFVKKEEPGPVAANANPFGFVPDPNAPPAAFATSQFKTPAQLLTERGTPTGLPWFQYDMVIIDEAQDMTDLFYELVCKIL